MLRPTNCALFIALSGLFAAPTFGVSIPEQYQPVYDIAFDRGYSNGYLVGFSEGEDRGETQGSKDGQEDGYSQGWEEVYQDAYDAAYDESYPLGFDDGYADGVPEGFEAGVERALIQLANDYRAYLTPFGPIYGNGTGLGSYLGVTLTNGGCYYGCGSGGSWSGGIEISTAVIESAETRYSRMGYDDGYDEGLLLGEEEGFDAAYPIAYDIAFDIGLEDGREEGTIEGNARGAENGFDAGWDKGNIKGNSDGFRAGWQYTIYGTYELPPVPTASSPATANTVPEPAAFSLLVIALMPLSLRRKP